eukprot:1136670-Pelagomonas_calceolata.AAC.2
MTTQLPFDKGIGLTSPPCKLIFSVCTFPQHLCARIQVAGVKDLQSKHLCAGLFQKNKDDMKKREEQVPAVPAFDSGAIPRGIVLIAL